MGCSVTPGGPLPTGSLRKNNKAATRPASSRNLAALFQGMQHLQPSLTLKRNQFPTPGRLCLQGTDIRSSNTHSAEGLQQGQGSHGRVPGARAPRVLSSRSLSINKTINQATRLPISMVRTLQLRPPSGCLGDAQMWSWEGSSGTHPAASADMQCWNAQVLGESPALRSGVVSSLLLFIYFHTVYHLIFNSGMGVVSFADVSISFFFHC